VSKAQRLLAALGKLHEKLTNLSKLDPSDVDQAVNALSGKATELLPFEKARLKLPLRTFSKAILLPNGDIVVHHKTPHDESGPYESIWLYKPSFLDLYTDSQMLFEEGRVLALCNIDNEVVFAYSREAERTSVVWGDRFRATLPALRLAERYGEIKFWLNENDTPCVATQIIEGGRGFYNLKILQFDGLGLKEVKSYEKYSRVRVAAIHEGRPLVFALHPESPVFPQQLFYRGHQTGKFKYICTSADQILFTEDGLITLAVGTDLEKRESFLIGDGEAKVLYDDFFGAELICGAYQDDEDQHFFYLDPVQGEDHYCLRSALDKDWKSNRINNDVIHLHVLKDGAVVCINGGDGHGTSTIEVVDPKGKVVAVESIPSHADIKVIGNKLLIVGFNKMTWKNPRHTAKLKWQTSHGVKIEDLKVVPDFQSHDALIGTKCTGDGQISIFRWRANDF